MTPSKPFFISCLLGLTILLDHAITVAQPSPTLGAAQPLAPSHQVDIGKFTIDQTEVTIGEFDAFSKRKGLVTAAERDGGGYEYSMGWTRRPGWNFRSPYGKPGASNEPAVHISWHEALAFCQDRGWAPA